VTEIRRVSPGIRFAIVATVLILSTDAALAQGRVEFGGFYGYQLGGRVNTNVGTIQIADHANYGFTLDLAVSRKMQIEISYSRQDSQAALLSFGNAAIPLFNTAIEYYQVGGLAEVSTNRIRPYVAVTAGVININPQPSGINNTVRFAFSAGAGIKAFITPHFGVRLQGRFLFPVMAANTAIFVVNGRGYFISSLTILVRGDLTAGLFIAL
jgi:Outer membrane protein beta-barrel domain